MPNLLNDPVIRAATHDGGRETLSLPQTLHLLHQDQIASFHGLRPHQEHPWHAFLTQLAVIAVQHAGLNEPPDNPHDWRRTLAAATQGETPWELIQDDLSIPAFLQNPVPDPDAIAKRGKPCPTPDSIDILFASKNHETKQDLIRDARPDHWIYALVCAQTSASYAGAGHPAASRMNGGYSSRPAVSLAPAQGGPGAHWRRDTEALLRNLDYRGDTARALLWTIPWTGAKNEAMDPASLHPLYLEVCRRLRLNQTTDGRIGALKTTAAGAIVDAKSRNGNTRDPWTPIAKSAGAAKPLHLQKDGFNHRLIAAILLDREKWEPPFLLQPAPQELRQGAANLIARGTAGGKCETNGFHSAIIPLSPPLLQAINDPRKADEALEIVNDRQQQLRAVRHCLSAAIETSLNGTREQPLISAYRDPARRRAAPVEQAANARMLDHLQEELAQSEPEARRETRRHWLAGPEGIAETARAILAAVPARSPAAGAAARQEFENRIGSPKILPGFQAARPVDPEPQESAPDLYLPSGAAIQAPLIAERIAVTAADQPGALVPLRNLNPDQPRPERFEAITAGLWELDDRQAQQRWALIVQGMALMTLIHRENADYRSAHHPGRPLGRAMAGAGIRGQQQEMIPPDQAETLLNGAEHVMRPIAARLFRRLAQAGARIDWAETAQLILEPQNRQVREKIRRDYRQARERRRTRH